MNKIITLLRTMYYAFFFRRGVNNFRVYGTIKLVDANSFNFGTGLRLNYGCYINATGGIKVGDNVTLSSGSKIISSTICLDKFKSKSRSRDYHDTKSVSLGDNVWLGANAIVLPGVSISGSNVIIASGAIVTKSFEESNVIIAGNPARIIKSI